MNPLLPPTTTRPSHVALAPARDLPSLVRYLAKLKNVSVEPGQVEALAMWAKGCLKDPLMEKVEFGDAPMTDRATPVVDRLLDIFAASEVLFHVATLIEGTARPDTAMLMRRAGSAVNRFTGGTAFFSWPGSMETFRLHYGHMTWGPFTTTQEDGSVITSYLRDGKLHRDPAEGPAWHRKTHDGYSEQYWVHGKLHRDPSLGPAVRGVNATGDGCTEEQYLVDGKHHRPAGEGPAYTVINAAGEIVGEAYFEDGQLHRDPAEGPAYYLKNETGTFTEYRLRGLLHRAPQDGPAFVEIKPCGLRVEEFYTGGHYHRPTQDGPAVRHTEKSGRIVRELYAEHGKRQRDPKLGPAWQGFEDGIEKSEYMVDDNFHRNEADGPAVIHRDSASGVVLLECYFQNGLMHRVNGPAHIERDAGGMIVEQQFWVNGERVWEADHG